MWKCSKVCSQESHQTHSLQRYQILHKHAWMLSSQSSLQLLPCNFRWVFSKKKKERYILGYTCHIRQKALQIRFKDFDKYSIKVGIICSHSGAHLMVHQSGPHKQLPHPYTSHPWDCIHANGLECEWTKFAGHGRVWKIGGGWFFVFKSS